MQLYDNAYPSTYDEIKTWYPVWYRDVLEMDALWRVWGEKLDEIQSSIIQTIDNNFIDFSDSRTLAKLEEFFAITYDGPRSIVERRNVIKGLIIGQGHIGQKDIKKLIEVFTAGDIDIALVGGAIRITVTRNFDDSFNLYDCHLVLDNRIPAHLVLDMVDKLLPVAVITENNFIFRDLKIALAIKNHSLLVDGICLDGKKKLDGTWTLDSGRPGIPFIDFHIRTPLAKNNIIHTPKELSIIGLAVKHTFGATTDVQFTAIAHTTENFRQESATIIGLGAKHPYQLSGSVLMDGRWTLNGDFILNGSKSLNQIYSEEDL